jgi:hypothetical protein
MHTSSSNDTFTRFDLDVDNPINEADDAVEDDDDADEADDDDEVEVVVDDVFRNK